MSTIQVPRNSKVGCLAVLHNQGFSPSTVIDVGAQVGTDALYKIFPNATHIMIEPVEENKEALLEVASTLEQAQIIIAAASYKSGETYLSVSKNIKYSHIVEDDNSKENNSELRKINCIAIDDLRNARSLKSPFLVKIDIDGEELNVLKGMNSTLKDNV